MASIDTNQPGLFGASFLSQEIISAVEGLFGASIGVDGNLVLTVSNRNGVAVRGANLTISWDNGTPYQILNTDPTLLYLDTFPTDTLLTVSVASSINYKAQQLTLTLPAGSFRRLDIVLEFQQAYARITKKRYY